MAVPMSTVLNVLLPIFGLILVGFICRRTNRLGPTAASEMNRFVVWLGLPALLFSLTAKADWAHIWQRDQGVMALAASAREKRLNKAWVAAGLS